MDYLSNKNIDKNIKRNKNVVFMGSAVITAGVAVWGIMENHSFAETADQLMEGLKQNFSWLYLGTMLFFVLFVLGMAISPFGKIRLGADDEKPKYTTVSWFAMLFAAGMGIGLVFWGVAEPLSHYVRPMNGVEPQTAEALHFSIRSCFMHWGIHPWACYAVMGLGLAYFQFRRKEPVLVSSILKPVLGKKLFGCIVGKSINIYTVVLTAVGVATSLGMGCLQICGGLEYLFHIPNRTVTWVVVIALICMAYLKSSLSGVGKGIKRLSDINLLLFTGLMAAALVIGPGEKIIHLMTVGIKDYIIHFFPDSLRLSSNGENGWIHNWRVFYWAWWLSWAPFVGVFIARISKGRTIREFIMGVIVLPTLVSVLWFSIFGGLTINVTANFTQDQITEMLASVQTILFHVFEQYQFGILLSLFAIVLLGTFFITSADSATFVLAMLTSDGKLDPPNNKKMFWGILIAVVAFALISSGNISVIQTVAIVMAFPYLFILLLVCVNLIMALYKDQKSGKTF